MKKFRVLETKSYSDSRGLFTRTFDIKNPDTPGFEVVQSNISFNPLLGTLRGLHYQVSGPPEEKLICLLSGSVFMVLVDLRTKSPSFLEKFEIEISSPLRQAIYIPSGYATGWISTSLNVSLQYQMSARYEECHYSGFRYDDPKFSINWPAKPKVISDQDNSWPRYEVNETY